MKWTVLSVGAMVFGAALCQQSFAGTYTDFEPVGFVDGASVDDRQPDGTTISPPMSFVNSCREAWFVPTAGTDEEIVDLGAGGKVWRLSNAVDGGLLGQNPHSPRNPDAISGETASLSNDACAPSTTPNYYAEFKIKSATDAAQSGMHFLISANSSDTRQGTLDVSDDGTGLNLGYYSTADGCNSFPFHPVASSLAYDVWHTVGMEIFFVGGLASGTVGAAGAEGNDVVNIYVDGILSLTSTTWESCVGARVVDQLLFETRDESAGNAGGGVYIDDVLVNDVCPEGHCNPPPPEFNSLGECISTLIGEECSGLTGRNRAQCNHEQQMFCFDLFGH